MKSSQGPAGGPAPAMQEEEQQQQQQAKHETRGRYLFRHIRTYPRQVGEKKYNALVFG